MSTITIVDKLPKELLDFKISHYKNVFQDQWERIFRASQTLENKEILVFKNLDKIIGGCSIIKDVYDLKFQDFTILPENSGQGYAKELMRGLEKIAKQHHQDLVDSGKKPKNIGLMYLRSAVYLDANRKEAKTYVLRFSPFLKYFGFTAHRYNKYELFKVETAAIEVLNQLYPDLINRLSVFKRLVVDEGVKLKTEIKEELLALDQRQWKIVMGGLDWKLGNYDKTGEVSYKFDLCPICEDVGSSGINSEPCKDCYIHITCMEPFRESWAFKENFEVSHAYFNAMKEFMLMNPPK